MNSILFKIAGQSSLNCYNTFRRLKAKIFTVMISKSFRALGTSTNIYPPLRLSAQEFISIGDGVHIGANSWLQVIPGYSTYLKGISIGNEVSVVDSIIISAASNVIVEDSVLIARNVYISDHSHRYTSRTEAVKKQGIEKISPVIIRKGAWIGQNSFICPGVTVGIGSVIGANSFVQKDVPNFSVAVGTPAKVVKSF